MGSHSRPDPIRMGRQVVGLWASHFLSLEKTLRIIAKDVQNDVTLSVVVHLQ